MIHSNQESYVFDNEGNQIRGGSYIVNDNPSRQPKEERQEEMRVLTDSNFFSELSKNEFMVVHCWAHWSSQCGEVAPIVEELARDHQGKIAFGKLNVDTNPLISETYAVSKVPSILVFKRGRQVAELSGYVPKTYIESKFRPHFENDSSSLSSSEKGA